MKSLPIEGILPEIRASLRTHPFLVLEAPPGAGKTTRVPNALLEDTHGSVLVLEPRRIAARMAARRVAAERGEKAGGTVGYQVRLESFAGPGTRLLYLTEGVLLQRLPRDPQLDGVAAVVLDEFHERHLETDVALALLRRLCADARKDLKVIVMSATMDSAPVAAFLGDCPVLRSSGRQHPLDVRYTPQSARPLEELVTGAVETLLSETAGGDILVFLPGAAEIRRAERACQCVAERAGAELVTLHGDLSAAEQDRAVTPGDRPKVILSTNVAESSITIEGVTAVVDSGLARVAEDSPWTGIPSLKLARISRASADQRAGRAGRLRAGRVIRLYSEAEYLHRPGHSEAEVMRRELSGTLLGLHAMGIRDPVELAWLEPPPENALRAAGQLLRELGAVDEGGELTDAGQRMSRLPLHPRLARLIVEAGRRDVGAAGCLLAAALSENRRLPESARGQFGPSDLLAIAEQPDSRIRRLAEQIRRRAGIRGQDWDSDETLLQCVLTGFPDRVARRRQEDELLLSSGGSARQSRLSVVRRAPFLVAVGVEERRERGAPLVRLASEVKAEWLLDYFPERIRESTAREWDRRSERVEEISALLYGEIAIEETRRPATPDAETARLLADRAWEAGLRRFTDMKTLQAFLDRAAFASQHGGVAEVGEGKLRGALQTLCQGCRSFRELQAVCQNGGYYQTLRSSISPADLRDIRELAPERIRLPGGRSIRIHYETKQPPWASSRLQDFFGMRETPRVARGEVPVVLHLLAPNMRPVQVTTDLAGFWARLYPKVRSELRHRYPKHAWPEKPD